MTTAREGFVSTALAAVMAASCGEQARFPSLPCGDPADYDNPRDAVLACAAQAAVAAASGAEPAARQAYARHLARWPVEDRFAERHLRRFLALGYVLSDRLRAHWDSVALGPSHLAARATARALVQARAGDLTAAGELTPAHALCFLPLPWSVELAARLAAAGHPHGHELGRWLADTLGPAVHRQLREMARSPLAAGAAQLLAALPAPPAHRTQIAVIGPMRLTRDGVPVDAPELRRARVRQLLSALAVRPVLTRDQAIELLWPGLDPAKAARNMRVTLTHLRRLLEPDRSGGDASYHLRSEGDTIRLLPSGFLSVDLWTLDTLDKRAVQARADGDIDRTAALLADAVALWRGDPLPDLHHVAQPGHRGRGRPGPHPPCQPAAGAGRTAPGRRRRGGVLRAGRACAVTGTVRRPRPPRRPRRCPQGPPSRPDHGGAPAGLLGTEAAWRPTGPADGDPPAAGGTLGQCPAEARSNG